MSEMVERGTSAILAKVPSGYGMTQAEAAGYAMAVIEAMRDPTAAMIEAASRTDRETDQYCATGEEHWQAMIDEALK